MFQRVRNLLQVTYCNPPTKKCAKVTTVPPLHGRRHQKDIMMKMKTAQEEEIGESTEKQ
jgi:hypothetical protein